MVECGFDHHALNAMDEGEFVFLLETRIELDQAREEARKAAAEG